MIKRRPFLKFGLAGSLLLRAGSAGAGPIVPSTPKKGFLIDEPTLGVWMDTLLPEDGDFPAASALGVHTRIRDVAKRRLEVAELLAEGLRWCDERSEALGHSSLRAAFQSIRDKIASEAEESPADSGPARFFAYTLERGYALYYADPRAWPALRYQGPPQPDGYPGFAGPAAPVRGA